MTYSDSVLFRGIRDQVIIETYRVAFEYFKSRMFRIIPVRFGL